MATATAAALLLVCPKLRKATESAYTNTGAREKVTAPVGTVREVRESV